MAIGTKPIENYVPVVKLNQGLYTKLSVTVAAGATVTLPSTTTIGGSSVSALGVITSTSANALTAGRQGATAPAFNVDASTASQADGFNVKGLAAGNGVQLSAITSGTNAPLTLDAAGSGTITIAGTSTGAVTITPATTISGALTLGAALKSTTATLTGEGALKIPSILLLSATNFSNQPIISYFL